MIMLRMKLFSHDAQYRVETLPQLLAWFQIQCMNLQLLASKKEIILLT